MKILLIAVGKTDSVELDSLIGEYVKRLARYADFSIQVITDVKNSRNMPEDVQKQREGEAILTCLRTGDRVILLDERGKEYTSEGFADGLKKIMNSGIKRLVFVIGGPYGFSSDVYARADDRMCLSRMTFSHQMVRLFFVEQLYRGHAILAGLPYHHG
ncbi:MAG: 23S rRNA (pseudouridine(1915)-N(3))-methyltransferase RlmH [Flavobacteriales bacterium]|nr:MAG: 23S rRNA (pseudouridine(1915)-N(3))-methyltransferase RlmH [Flavobacteriales bacterium]